MGGGNALVIPSAISAQNVESNSINQDTNSIGNIDLQMDIKKENIDIVDSSDIINKNKKDGSSGNSTSDDRIADIDIVSDINRVKNDKLDVESSIEFDVNGPQPSELWPSDHFMIVVKASF